MKRSSLICAAFAAILTACGAPEEYSLTVGTNGTAIHRITFDGSSFVETGTLEANNANFICFGDDGTLYAPNRGGQLSNVVSFKGDVVTGVAAPSGRGPCHVMAPSGLPFVVTANYSSGSVSVYPVDKDGAVHDATQEFQYYGAGPFEERQSQAHIHQVREIPAKITDKAGIKGRWMLATDLGSDRIHVLQVDDEAIDDNYLINRWDIEILFKPGAGPRHMEFNERHQLLYVVSELSDDVYVFEIGSSEKKEPEFKLRQIVPTPGTSPEGGADIHLSPDGKYLYTSYRRGNDGLAVFKVESEGSIEFSSYSNCRLHPRNFNISPDGKYVFVGSMDENILQVFKRDAKSGELSLMDVEMDFKDDKPICILL